MPKKEKIFQIFMPKQLTGKQRVSDMPPDASYLEHHLPSEAALDIQSRYRPFPDLATRWLPVDEEYRRVLGIIADKKIATAASIDLIAFASLVVEVVVASKGIGELQEMVVEQRGRTVKCLLLDPRFGLDLDRNLLPVFVSQLRVRSHLCLS